MTLYLISGLGADHRVFRKLIFPPGVHVQHIHWVEPLKGESLRDYCIRLSEQVNTKEPFSLLGVSFGGIIAQEMGRFLQPEKLIIISSLSTRQALPLLYKSIAAIRLHRFFPYGLLPQLSRIAEMFFGVKTKLEKNMLHDILHDTSPQFTRWAMIQVLEWKNETKMPGLIHIHGTADKILPYRLAHPDYTITGGEHLMIFNRAKEVSQLLAEILGGKEHSQ